MLADGITTLPTIRPPGPGSMGETTHQVAIVHDYLSERGGAERVVLTLADAFPAAPLYTSVFDAPRYPELTGRDVRPSVLNRLPAFRKWHRITLPFLAAVYSHLDVDAEVVVCSSSGWAHGVRTDAAKIVYCHNPARWLYQRGEYGETLRRYRIAAAAVAPVLQRWDQRAAAGCDRYLANSASVARRIKEIYGLEAEVLPPPTSVDPSAPQTPIAGIDPGYVMVVGRLLGYKHVAEVVEAFRLLPSQRLLVVGDGPQRAELMTDAPKNVTFTGRVDEAQLRWLYANCAALVSASHEDFGLTPVEAGLFGKPVAVLRAGGFLDTTIEGVTGLFFEQPEPWAIAEGIRRVVTERWDSGEIAVAADRFSIAGFTKRMHEIVEEAAAARS